MTLELHQNCAPQLEQLISYPYWKNLYTVRIGVRAPDECDRKKNLFMWQDTRDVRKPLVRDNIFVGCAAGGRALPAHFELEVRPVFEPVRPSACSKLSRRRRNAERVVGVQVDSFCGGASAGSSSDGSWQAFAQNDRGRYRATVQLTRCAQSGGRRRSMGELVV